MSTWPINDQDPNLVTIDVGFIQQQAEFRKRAWFCVQKYKMQGCELEKKKQGLTF